MTATEAGQPAKDPEDGPGAGRGASDADGTVTVDPGRAGADWLDAARLTSEGGTAERRSEEHTSELQSRP